MRAMQVFDDRLRLVAAGVFAALLAWPAAGICQEKSGEETAAAAAEAPPTIIRMASPLVLAVTQERDKAVAAAPSRSTPPPPAWRLFASVGGSFQDVDGKLPGKFQENRDNPTGLFLQDLDIRYLSAESPYLFSLRTTEVRENDEGAEVDLWKVGTFRTRFLWTEVPRFFGRSPSLEVHTAPGVLSVSPSIRAALQVYVGSGPLPQNIPAAFFDLIRAEMARAPMVDIGYNWDRGRFEQSYQPNEHVDLHASAQSTRTHGVRPLGAASFARQNNIAVPAPGPNDGVWEALGVELPAPFDYRTIDVSGGAKFSGARWTAGIDYHYSQFRDEATGITYDNPFRASDPQAGAPAGSANGRLRFVTSQVAYPADYDLHQFIGRAGFDFGRQTNVHGLFSWSESRQNQQFLPFTLNPGLVGTGPGLANNLPPGVSVLDLAALPQQSLNGKTRTINQDYSLVSRAVTPMTFRLQYRSEDSDNKSPIITFPGFSRFGESHWVQSLDYYNVPIRNLPESFERQDASASWRWDIAQSLSTTFEYQYEHWDRTFRNVRDSAEHSGLARVDFKPSSAVTMRLEYGYGERKPKAYLVQPLAYNPSLNVGPPGTVNPGGPGWEVVRGVTVLDPSLALEFNQLRQYDQAERKRRDALASLDLRLAKDLTFSASYRYEKDQYPGGFYGLQFNERWNGAAELSYAMGERGFLFLNYSRDESTYKYLDMGHLITGSVINTTACCAQYPIANSWDRHGVSVLNSFQVGVNVATPGDAWVFDGSYAYSFSRESIRTTNPFGPVLSNSPNTAGVQYQYPNATNEFQELLLTVTRKIGSAMSVGVQYRYEPYKVDDFYLNNLNPFAYPQLTVGGVPTNVQRYLFLNARYGNYTANQVSVFLRYRS
ncbi:MAG: MtrB/PioB family outer membrane beta-barrel protein [Thermoanaerobaculia bacterium]